ncbi:hypothetical protein [Lactococcus lactis]|uniref:hypothetical protein n=1 Tax=Lactococcus lactis TaxID=1358 RepID=UPI0021A9330A|nr:hypothetical protein [Lactococcus lactis]MBS5602676.1 hypothetical protein [Lactococcus lactis]MCT3099551.1 hypothetical protein [Lactococcus lactis]
MRKKYTLEIDQPNFNPNERLQAVVDYFVELGKSVVVENLHTVIIEGERYRILSRSENSSVIKTLVSCSIRALLIILCSLSALSNYCFKNFLFIFLSFLLNTFFLGVE